MKFIETRIKRNLEFTVERSEFMERVKMDRELEKTMKNDAAVRIQALVRGHCLRVRRGKSQSSRAKTPAVLSISDIRAELCKLAEQLELKPIKGLTLAVKAKNSKRMLKIENAAAFRIQAFLHMIVARKKARRILEGRIKERKAKAARRIASFFRFARGMAKFRRLSVGIKNSAAITIQCGARKFRAIQRFVKVTLLECCAACTYNNR
jgi:hypothetical protein